MATRYYSIALLLLSLSQLSLSLGNPPAVNLTVITDRPVDIWAAVNFTKHCGFLDIPDIPARAFVGSDNITHMIEGSTSYHHMVGDSVLRLNRSCAFAYNSTDDPNPAHFAGNEFLDATWAFPNNDTVVTLVHTEYPGNVYHNCSGPAYPHCWTVTLGLAVSHDGGSSWQHARPPPAHLVAAVPYGYNQSQLAYGWGDPSNIVEGPGDGFWYAAMWNRNQVGLQPPGICIMRTDSLMEPAAWRGWSGSAFDVPFVSPYTLTPGQEGQHVCTPVNLPAPDCAAMGLTYARVAGVYIVTMDCQTHSFMYATSADLVHWSDAAPFYSADDLPAAVRTEVTRMTYPTFMDPAAPSRGDRNFATVGDTASLFWVSIGHSPYTDGRHLWATSMRIDKA